MPKAKGKDDEILLRRMQAMELRLRNMSMRKIAAKLDVNVMTISNDLKAVEEMWKESCLQDYATLIGREEARILQLIGDYRKEFIRSCFRYEYKKDKNGNHVGKPRKLRVPGGIEYLDGIKSCIEKLWKLRGLAQDTTIHATQNNVNIGPDAQKLFPWEMLYQAPKEDPVEAEIRKVLESVPAEPSSPLEKLQAQRAEEKVARIKANGQAQAQEAQEAQEDPE